MRQASFLSRATALLIDSFFMFGIGVVLTLGLMIFGTVAERADSQVVSSIFGIASIFVYFGILFIQFLYFGILWSQSGQTIGMRLMSIQVVRQGGGDLSFLVAAFRGTVGYYLSGIFFGLGFIWAALDPDGEALHDKLFSTRVVNT